ncbi:transposase [Arsenophonus nasoniae]|uniref:Transposase n=1 Tax=Arsenophonus nasoniae TaxID=638 RepID=A0ABY8NU39_9GAMM|nr:transposase [Arsenophonus nasoniae]WGM07842.1 transposase [Arsenophonus nasoniae]
MHTYGRQLNQHPHIHLSVTRGDSLNMTPGNRFSLKRKTLKRSGAVRSFDSLGITIFSYNPINCLASGTFAIIRPGAVTSMPSFNVIGKYILPKDTRGLA